MPGSALLIVRLFLGVAVVAAAWYFGADAVVVVLVGALAVLVLMKARALRRRVDE